jgi:hypothetical protein
VDRVDVGARVEPARDPALVRHDEHEPALVVQAPTPLRAPASQWNSAGDFT